MGSIIVMMDPPIEAKDVYFGGGSGTVGDPYVIEDVWDLQNMSKDLTAHYVLGNDIDASDTVNWNSGAGFDPIGYSNRFIGSLDGKGYNISDLYINRSSTNSVGFFKIIGTGGSVKNVNLIEFIISGEIILGGLVGVNEGNLTNCYATGTTSGINGIGGLVGYNHYGNVTNCSAKGVTIGAYSQIGGLVGYNYYGTVTNCYAMGTTSGIDGIGGLVGVNWGIVTNSSAAGTTNGNISVGGLIGHNSGTVTNSHYNINTSLINNGHRVTLGGLFRDQYQDWYSSGLSLKISDYNRSLVSNGSYYEISSVQGLKDLLGFADNREYRFRLTSDIDLSSISILNIPYFVSKEFDGGGYAISNLFINQSFSSNLGMFGEIRPESTVSNLKLLNINIVGSYHVGGLVGDNYGTVTNCSVAGTTSGDRYVGGLVGFNYEGNVTDCYAIGDVSGAGNRVGGLVGSNYEGTLTNCSVTGNTSGRGLVGGLIGDNNGIVTNCSAAGNVSGSSWDVGGLVGYNTGTVSNCYATRTTSGIRNVGGLVGCNFGIVTNCSATGNTIGSSEVGGLLGHNDRGTVTNCYATGNANGSLYVGGLVGQSYFGTVRECFAIGNTSGIEYVGGLVGSNMGGAVMNCYSTGTTNGNSSVGGLVGSNVGNYDFGTVTNCYSTGTTSGTDDYVGGLVGSSWGGNVTNCFWDINNTGQNSSAGGTGKTTSEMKTRTTFTDAGWDFDNIWCMIENTTYPFFKWQDTKRPKANAGSDMIVDEGALVEFDGSGSWDDMGIEIYEWSFTDEKPVTLYGVKPEYHFNNPGMFTITLNVQDAVDTWDSDTMTVTVLDVTRPVPDAGPDKMVDEGTVVIFNGSGSYDNVGIANYTWTFYDKGQVTLYGVRQEYRFDSPGNYEVTLKVSDTSGNYDTDNLEVRVLDLFPPIADAGPDQTVAEGTVVTFDGSKSYDTGGIAYYTWIFIYNDEQIFMNGPHPHFLFDIPGTYSVTLTVMDHAGRWDSDRIEVKVLDITRPLAEAGSDRTVDEDTTLTFDGRRSHDNVGIASYTWTFFDGIEDVVLQGSTPSHIFTVPGRYTVTLTVMDEAGNSGSDTMTVSVRDITPPIANAGEDLVVDEGSSVQFDASGSFDNVMIVNYTWTVISGSQRTSLYGVNPVHVFGDPGVYVVTLEVLDGAGLTDSHAIMVTVLDATPPASVAGPDRIVDVGILVIFDGSGSSDNVGIVNYTWTFNDGSANVILYGIHPSHTFSIPGTYTITLTVTDEAGNEGIDSFSVDVIAEEKADDHLAAQIAALVILVPIFVLVFYLLIRSRRRRDPEE